MKTLRIAGRLRNLACAIALPSFLAVSQPANRGVIAGSVIEASDNQPVHKAIVTLTLQETPKMWATARSDADGRFKFDSLPAGTYDLRAAKIDVGTAIHGANTPHEAGELISLADGETRAGLPISLPFAAARPAGSPSL